MCVVDSHLSFLSPYCSSCIWLKSSSLVTLHRLPCAYCTKPRFLRLTFKACSLPTPVFCLPPCLWHLLPGHVWRHHLLLWGPWHFLPWCLCSCHFFCPVCPLPYNSCLIVYTLLTEIFNQCYLLGILLNMPWQMETHPCPAGCDWHTRSWKSR